MNRVFELLKVWTVDLSEDGTPVCTGPSGIKLTVDPGSVWLEHDVTSFELVGALVTETVRLNKDWFVAALRAHGWTVEPPTG